MFRQSSVVFAALSAAFLLACGGGGGGGNGGGSGGGSGGGNGNCSNACAEGAKACDGNGVKVCEQQSDGCFAWSAVTACASNEICDSGACRKNCTDNCGAGTSLCEGSGYRACEQKANGCYDWAGSVTACTNGNVCSGGACVQTCQNQCTENSKQCTTNGTVTCQRLTTGCTEWVNPTTCPSGEVCSGGACVPNGSCTNQCTAGASRCTSTGQQQDCVTLSSGCTDWALPKNCAAGSSCQSGGTTCTAANCTAGETRCNGTSVETCTAAGTWLSTQTCPQACSNGSCSATTTCSAGAVRCNGNGVETCNSSGTAWLYTQTCSVSCNNGVCTGPCTAGEKRCNGNTPETCNSAGTAWTAGTACTTSCFEGACIQADLVVDGVTVTMSGVNKFQNSVVVQNGGKIQVGGDGGTTLQIIANTISVDSASSISANGIETSGNESANNCSDTDLSTCAGYGYSGSYRGGGVIDLRASTITINGQITANGAGYYGGGGTVLLAADKLLGSGAVQAVYGGYNSGTYYGLVKLLYGSQKTLAPTITGARQQSSIMPPLNVVSASHPSTAVYTYANEAPSHWYNDGANSLELAWQRPYAGINGYYYRISTAGDDIVDPSNGTFLQAESVSIPLTNISGRYYVHIVSVDASANVGTVRNVFPVYVNSVPPTVSSSSHPSQGVWYTNNAAYVSWNTGGLNAADTTGYYYVLDKFGDTLPTASNATFTTNPQTLLSNLQNGTWVFHIVSRDLMNRTTKNASHFKLFIGTEPPKGNLSGSIFDGANASAPLTGVQIRVNRGLWSANSTTSGTYTFNNGLYEGTWEVTASKAGYTSQTKTVTITAGNTTNENFVLQPAP